MACSKHLFIKITVDDILLLGFTFLYTFLLLSLSLSLSLCILLYTKLMAKSSQLAQKIVRLLNHCICVSVHICMRERGGGEMQNRRVGYITLLKSCLKVTL